MSNFLNKNKFKNKFFRVAIKALVFSVFCFFFLYNVNFVEAESCVVPKDCKKSTDTCVQGQCVDEDGTDYSKQSRTKLDKAWDLFTNPIDSTLLAILEGMSWLVKAAVFLFEIAVNPELFNKLFRDSGTTLYEMWGFIRDFLNIFFILILLFSAFATVFQVSKYHIQKILLSVVLMALLVNFSWTITRIIIDLSNVTMYFFIDEMLLGSGETTAKIGALSNLSDIMVPGDFSKVAGAKDTTYLLLAITVVFIFGVTLLAYAGVLLIRVIALVLLLIFSPVGFVAAAFPSTSKYASQWWDALFKYAFSGPTLIFMLVVAIKMLEAIGGSGIGENELRSIISKEGLENNLNNMAESIALFTIPIMILWTALITSGKAGDAGSAWVSNKMQGWSKKTGKFVGKYGKKGVVGGVVGGVVATGRGVDFATAKISKDPTNRPFANLSGTFQGVKQRGKDVWAGMERERQAQVDTMKAGAMGALGDKTAIQRLEDTKIAEVTKKHKEEGVSTSILADRLKDAKGSEYKAIVKTLVDRKDLNKEDNEKLSEAIGKVKTVDGKADEKMQGAIIKKLSDSRNGHLAIKELEKFYNDPDSRREITDATTGLKRNATADENMKEATKVIISRLDNAGIAKNSELLKQALPGSGAANQSYLRNRIKDRIASPKVLIDVQSKMTSREDFRNLGGIVT